MFANGPGDLGSIPDRVIQKTQKMVLDASLLSTQHYKVRIKGKVEQSREGVAPSPTHWCSSYRKGSLRITLDYGRQLYLLIYKKMDLAFINLQWLICHITSTLTYVYKVQLNIHQSTYAYSHTLYSHTCTYLILIYINVYLREYLRFGLVSLFNGISALVVYIMPKPISLKNSSGTIWEDEKVHTFPKGICPKVNVIARLEYELAYYDSAVQRFNHYTIEYLQVMLKLCYHLDMKIMLTHEWKNILKYIINNISRIINLFDLPVNVKYFSYLSVNTILTFKC